MEFIPVANTAQVELIGMQDNQKVQNVLHYTKATPWTIGDLTELCAAARDEWNTSIKPLVAAQFFLTAIRATDMSSQTGPVVDFTSGLPIQGTVGVAALPNNVALVITKRTALRGRSYRGRIYHGGLTTSQVVNNTVTPAVVTNIRNGWDALRGLAIIGDEGLMVVVSKKNNGVWRTNGVATLVTNLTSDGSVDSQRRRLPGRGS